MKIWILYERYKFKLDELLLVVRKKNDNEVSTNYFN